MSTDADESGDEDRMTKIDVRVPESLLDAIDEAYAERGYSSRSEAVRDALRTWVDPPARLSEGTIEDLARSRQQAERGETHSADAVRDRLGLDDSGEE